ncbi:MAG: LysM peptidoglycan-binding domain-containing protein, partial [Gammaproteobacteria bacterium]|nr:LysM peptidoglycan-binding domain-containing protein [Gammaproteobacteria bacterium]
MRGSGIVIIGLVILLVGAGGCARFVDYGEGYSREADYSDPKPPKNTTITYHTVRKGETLYSIAWQYGHDYRSVARWNDVPRSYTIYPGQKLRVRPPNSQGAAKSSSNSTAKKSTSRQTTTTRKVTT